jgi:hypothetical protein
MLLILRKQLTRTIVWWDLGAKVAGEGRFVAPPPGEACAGLGEQEVEKEGRKEERKQGCLLVPDAILKLSPNA